MWYMRQRHGPKGLAQFKFIPGAEWGLILALELGARRPIPLRDALPRRAEDILRNRAAHGALTRWFCALYTYRAAGPPSTAVMNYFPKYESSGP
jgi:hypothetical protein